MAKSVTPSTAKPTILDLPNGSLLRRLGTMLYDWLLVIALWFAVSALFVTLNGGESPPNWVKQFILFPVLVLITFLYFAWFWIHSGQTVGMRAWRLRIIDIDGGKPSWLACTKRFLWAGLSMLSLGLGFWWIGFNKDNLAWHDFWTNTKIVVLPKT